MVDFVPLPSVISQVTPMLGTQNETKINVSEMRCLRSMLRITMVDKAKSSDTWGVVENDQ
jgi:hypothetical protein